MRPSTGFVKSLLGSLPTSAQEHLEAAVRAVVDAKQRGGRIVVVTGSGPNIHEGVTTQIAELMHKGLVDGVITSSAVIAHEMAGTLDRVKRVQIGDARLPIASNRLPRGDVFEITLLSPTQQLEIAQEIDDGWDLYERLSLRDGTVVVKAAGNLAWPMGLRTERLAREIRDIASQRGMTFEQVAGFGADPRTIIGAGAHRNMPVLVSVPQLVGGGGVGIAIGDSMSIGHRSTCIAKMLASADVIIESAIALCQEIHDGPFETYTGHGIWAAWDHYETYSLNGKTLVRMDLDPNLERAWSMERKDAQVQNAVDRGLPKTKRTGIPFRMEMSGFARLESSLPVTADIGVAWPVLALALEERLGTKLEFICAPQESAEGKRMREWIADEVKYLDRKRIHRELQTVPS